ncbi:tetratricopeptide repeat protein [Lederbergia graminis]|uniref:Tetratricopeptide repeat protein n=1 Tax=Lederbergia graminis TaxID=735518 RepID=A0ABW0LLR0_9BACI
MFKDSKAHAEKAKILPFIPTGEYYFNKGLKAYDRYDINKAKKYLKRAWELEPYEPMIACQLAIVYTEAEEYEESNRLLFTVLEELDARMTECHYFIANNFAHLGMFTESYKHAQLYLENDTVGEFAEDAEELMSLIGFDDENIEVLEKQDEIINRLDEARLLLETGEFNKAVEMLEQAVIDYPEFWPAHNNLALAYFYEGDTGKATGVLEKVFENNPGNLHALCNLAVFLFYEHETEKLKELLTALEKVQPILLEHRYKLGATFALTGKYEQAYYWLRQIQKQGFHGDPGFYYWLAKSAYFTGNEKVAQHAWKDLANLNPDYEKMEPWNEITKQDPRTSDGDSSIMKMLRSDRLEERLYGIFMIAISNRKQELITHADFKQIDEFSLTEKIYLAIVLQTGNKDKVDPEGDINRCHEVALILYEKYKDKGYLSRNLLLSWFSIFISCMKAEETLRNTLGIAAAVEYIWLKHRNNKKTQKTIAEEYAISPSTLRKYIQLLEVHLV